MKTSVFVIGALLFAAEAQAQSIDGSFRVALEAQPLELGHVTLNADSGTTTATTTTLGLPGPALGGAVGYGVSKNVVLGARVLASSTHTQIGEVTADTSGFALFPQLEYLFSGAAVRPFVSANIGYRGTGASGNADSSTSTFLIGPGAGVHGFVSSAFSLDAGVMALFQTGTSKVGTAEVDTGGYSVLLTLALSAWLGGGTEAASAPPPPKPAAADSGSIGVEKSGVIHTTFALDLPETASGVQVRIQGDPKQDVEKTRVIVSFVKPASWQSACSSVAFEAAGARTELTDLRSSSRGGFGSSLTTQGGLVAFDTLGTVADSRQETWLTICEARVLMLPAAKRQIERFMQIFRSRAGAGVGR